MIKLENYEVMGWKHAIRGMRNPMNSWEKGDSDIEICDRISCKECSLYRGKGEKCLGNRSGFMYDQIPLIGPNDHKLMMNLRNAGTDHRKYMRMITVYVDITAPLYWWKEFDTYKVGTVANSCSTMHKIHEKEFTLEDFSCEHLIDGDGGPQTVCGICGEITNTSPINLMFTREIFQRKLLLGYLVHS